MKTKFILISFISIFLSSCAIGPDGKKHYIGPKIKAALTYRGVGLEFTLFDPINPDDTKVIDLTPKKEEPKVVPSK